MFVLIFRYLAANTDKLFPQNAGIHLKVAANNILATNKQASTNNHSKGHLDKACTCCQIILDLTSN